MNAPYINIHTHRRTGEGIEVVSVMAGRGAWEAAGAMAVQVSSETTGATGHACTASAERALPVAPFSVGVHPWQLPEMDEADLEAALREVETAPAYAIGEIGLDYAIPGDHGQQKMVFAAQLRIAEERGLPVVLHCVRAFEPTMEILAGFRLPAVIFHGFIGSSGQSARATIAGYYLSFGERSLSSPKTVEALQSISPEKLFLETDDALISIAEIYARTATILNVTGDRLAQIIFDNYERLVGKN